MPGTPRRRLTNRSNPATRVHLFCRALAFLFELAVLIFLIYISKTQGYSNGIRYAGVSPPPAHCFTVRPDSHNHFSTCRLSAQSCSMPVK
ncbi:uncharacterized protein C8A04DRAFT_14323 [Dichotomopilus funicola]|uniref:Uncharacterized protein n=1 Tax=Dichotomopilus funicola TaxID=1934379 RepID=A0AAN6ZJ47_9PEZI|nr:hypothetical protein C8A04DRAFT_14323 [Dichotomopilus funicola]